MTTDAAPWCCSIYHTQQTDTDVWTTATIYVAYVALSRLINTLLQFGRAVLSLHYDLVPYISHIRLVLVETLAFCFVSFGKWLHCDSGIFY